MKRPRVIFGLITLGALAVTVVIFHLVSPPDPVYQGQPLSYWLKRRTTPGPEFAKAVAVASQAGPEAVPRLVAALETGDSRLRTLYSSAWKKLPLRLQKTLPRPVTSAKIRETAVAMLRDLGTNAMLALPALTNALHDPDPWVQTGAASAIRRICSPVATDTAVPRMDFSLSSTARRREVTNSLSSFTATNRGVSKRFLIMETNRAQP